MSCKHWTDTKTRSFLVHLTMRVTRLLLVQRIILVVYGRTSRLCRLGTNKIEKKRKLSVVVV